MRFVILLFATLLILFSSNFISKAQSDVGDLIIEALEFPDTVTVGEVHLLSGIVTNTGNVPIFFDFDIGIDFDLSLPGLNFGYIFEELIPCVNCDLLPGESRSFSKPVYMSNQRVATNQENIILTWPTDAIGGEPSEGQIRSRRVYVRESEPDNGRNPENFECNDILIEQLEGVINITGLYDAEISNISVVNQFHEVIYYCNNNCPNDEITVDISDGGYYLVQVNLVNGFDYCYKTGTIITENWLNYGNYINDNDFPSYGSLSSIFELPNLIYDNITGLIYDSITGLIYDTDNRLTNYRFIGSMYDNIDGLIYDKASTSIYNAFTGLIDNSFLGINNFWNMFNVFNNEPKANALAIPFRVPNQYLGFGCGIEAIIENEEFKFTKPSEGSASIEITDKQGNIIFECKGATCDDTEIIVQLPDLENMKYSIDVSYTNGQEVCSNSISMGEEYMFDVWNNSFDVCSLPEFIQAPSVNSILNESAIVFLKGFFADGLLQFKKKDAAEWQDIPESIGTNFLSNLEKCTTYEIRAKYSCNEKELFSDTQTFTTLGCIDCNIDNADIRISNIFGSTAFIHWDIFSGMNYILNYKKQGDVEWKNYETSIPFALLFNLDECATYEFYLEILCVDGVSSTPGEVINLATGNCRLLDSDNTSLRVYPEAANDFVNINTENAKEISDIHIYNQSGMLLQRIDGSSISNGVHRLDISSFSNGLYIVVATSKNKIHNKKFMKY